MTDVAEELAAVQERIRVAEQATADAREETFVSLVCLEATTRGVWDLAAAQQLCERRLFVFDENGMPANVLQVVDTLVEQHAHLLDPPPRVPRCIGEGPIRGLARMTHRVANARRSYSGSLVA